MTQTVRLLSFVTAVTLTLTNSLGQEWPRFRGADGLGVAEADSIPTAWTPQDYAWRIALPGLGHSSPVVWGDHIYVTSAVQEDATRHVFCIDASEGRTVWERSFPSSTFDLGNATGYDECSPTVDEDRVYVVWANPEHFRIMALNRHSGATIWQRDLGAIDSEHGFGTSPILFGDLVVLQCDNKARSWIAALDAKTGHTRWEVERTCIKTAYGTPLVFSPEGGSPQLITTGWGPGFTAYDPESGKQLWQLPIFKFRCVGSPFVAGGLVFASAGTGGSGRQMFAVAPGVPETGQEAKIAYEIAPPIPYVPTPVARGSLLFLWGDAGVVRCLDIPTGEVHWQERVGGRYFGSPILVQDRLYCLSREGSCVVLAAEKEYRLLAKVDLEEPSHSTPAVADGVMYLRTFGHLMALGKRD